MRRMRVHALLAASASCLVLLPASSCASHGASSSGDAPCGSPPPDQADLACVLRVDGAVTDLAGAAVPNASVSMCSRQCYGAAAGADGTFSIAIGGFLRAGDYALHVSGRPDFADVYQKVAPPVDRAITLGVPVRLPRLPASGPALPADKAPASRVTSGDLTFDVPDGATFVLDVGDIALGAKGRQLRVARVALDATPEFAKTLTGVVALYALAPPGAKSSAPLGVHIANATGLPASSAVELLVLDDDYRPLPPTAGSARAAATAHVSSDGTMIDSDPGQGISTLTWIVVRRSR